jgi:hypothetical protein
MQEKYELIDAFSSSLAKYQVSLIAATLEGTKVDPCNTMYEKIDRHENESVEDIVERFAFESPEQLQLYLDAKKHYFNSRRINPILLTSYLKSKFGYDTVKISEFREDKNALFLMLFHEMYNPKNNELDGDFTKAQAASHKFKDKRDRMTTIDESFDLESVEEKIPEFEEIMNSSDNSYTICESHINEDLETLTILLRQEHKRKMEPTFEFRTRDSDAPNEPEIVYEERYPIRETAVQIKNIETGTEIQVYFAVSPWDETFMRLFTTLIEKDIVARLSAKKSSTAKKIMEDIKETTQEEGGLESAAQVQNIVSENVAIAATKVEDDDSTLSPDFVEEKLSETIVTGVQVDVGEGETTFEVHSNAGISSLLEEYDGMAASLSQAVSSASIDDITIYAKIPGDSGSEDEIVLENGEWYMSSNSTQSTMKALEAALT